MRPIVYFYEGSQTQILLKHALKESTVFFSQFKGGEWLVISVTSSSKSATDQLIANNLNCIQKTN